MAKRIGFIAEIRGNGVNGNKINFSWLGPSKESSHQVLGDMQSDKLMRGWDKDRCVQGFVDAYDSYLEVEIYPVSVQNTVKESFQNPDTAFKITESIVGKMRAMEMVGKRGISLIKFGGTIVFQTRQDKIERVRSERKPGVYEITTGSKEQSAKDFLEELEKEEEKESKEAAEEMGKELEELDKEEEKEKKKKVKKLIEELDSI